MSLAAPPRSDENRERRLGWRDRLSSPLRDGSVIRCLPHNRCPDGPAVPSGADCNRVPGLDNGRSSSRLGCLATVYGESCHLRPSVDRSTPPRGLFRGFTRVVLSARTLERGRLSPTEGTRSAVVRFASRGHRERTDEPLDRVVIVVLESRFRVRREWQIYSRQVRSIVKRRRIVYWPLGIRSSRGPVKDSASWHPCRGPSRSERQAFEQPTCEPWSAGSLGVHGNGRAPRVREDRAIIEQYVPKSLVGPATY